MEVAPLCLKLPQIASNGYGNVIVKDSQKSESGKKQSPRTEPKNLEEQLTLEEAKTNEGKRIMENEINDPKYPKKDWKKQQYVHENFEGTGKTIHYWENIQTGEKHGFKFKD